MRRAQDRARTARSRKNGARSATIESRALGALKLASEALNENVPAKRADFFLLWRYNYSLFPVGKVINMVPLSPKNYGNSVR